MEAIKNMGVQATQDNNLDIYLQDKYGLSADLCKLQNRFVFQGHYKFNNTNSSYNKVPTLKVDGKDMGKLTALKIEELKKTRNSLSFWSWQPNSL